MRHHTLLSACLRAGFCLALLLSAQVLFGQTEKTITLNYNENSFEYLYDNDGCLTICSNHYEFRYSEDSAAPSIPILSFMLLIKEDQEFQELLVKGNERVVKTGIRMLPNPYVTTTENKKVFQGHRSTDYQNDSYPSASAKCIGTKVIDGYKLLSFEVTPYRFNTHKGELLFMDNMSVDVTLSTSQKTMTSFSNSSLGNNMKETVRSIVINGNELEQLYNDGVQPRSTTVTTLNDTVDYLIITNAALASSFAPLVSWKKQKGVRTKVITVEEIYSQYTNSSWRNQVKIKHCIEDHKNQNHTQFVLLGGDTEVVPAQPCYIKNNFAEYGLVEDSVETDVFYASFDNDFGWDANGNGIVGEISGDLVDMGQDIYLTRVSVSTTSDVNAFVTKTINYEKNPPVSTWKNRVLMAGGEINFTYTINNRLMTDAEYESDMLYSNSFSNRWNGTRTKYFTTWSSLINAPTTLTLSEFQSLLADGYSIIDVNAHGTIDGWSASNSTLDKFYNQAYASNLVSNQPSIVVTEACFTNSFNTLPEFVCLSEVMLRNPNNGVVGYWGSSHYGISIYSSTPPSSLGTSAFLNSKFYQALFSTTEEFKNFGKMAFKAKVGLNANNTPYSPRWLHFAVNAMGDCEMPIYTTTPKTFDNVSLTISNNTLSVNSGLTDCRICVMDLDNNAGYYRIIDGAQSGTFTSLPLHYSLCITKQDYVPYWREMYRNPDTSGNYYIQNETLEENRIYNATNMMIGRDVTTGKPNGDVTVERGNTTINASGNVTIKNNFEVKNGAQFSIE